MIVTMRLEDTTGKGGKPEVFRIIRVWDSTGKSTLVTRIIGLQEARRLLDLYQIREQRKGYSFQIEKDSKKLTTLNRHS